MLFKLAWRNLWRNRNRTLITMSSVFFAVMLSVLIDALQTGAFDNLVKNVVEFYSSYIQVHQKGYFEEQTLDNVLTVNDSLITRITSQKNVRDASPRIETFVLASTGDNTQGCMMVGIIPSKEGRLIELNKRVSEGTYMPDSADGVMIGAGLARKLNLKLGDTIVLLGQGYQGATAAGKYRIRTVLKFGSPQLNEKMLFMPLGQAQQFLGAEGKATTIAVSIDNVKSLRTTQSSISKGLFPAYEVITWEEIMPEIVEHIRTDKGSGLIITLILYLLVSFGIFTTLLMMMAERKYEFGMLRAIGMKKLQLARVLILESVFVTLAGCLMGIAASIPLVYYMSIHPIRFGGEFKKTYEKFGFEAVIPTSTSSSIFIKQAVIITIISLLLSLYPLYKVFAMKAINAIKR
jgi:ABC-type lipoprotein release transport system permease subunit